MNKVKIQAVSQQDCQKRFDNKETSIRLKEYNHKDLFFSVTYSNHNSEIIDNKVRGASSITLTLTRKKWFNDDESLEDFKAIARMKEKGDDRTDVIDINAESLQALVDLARRNGIQIK